MSNIFKLRPTHFSKGQNKFIGGLVTGLYFCVQDVEKYGFECVLRQVSKLCHFCPTCFQAVFLLFLTAQWRFRYTGSSGLARFLDYDVYWRTQACLLCIFVPQPTVPLHYFVNSSSFVWAFSLFIYFRSMSGLSPEANFHFQGPRLF